MTSTHNDIGPLDRFAERWRKQVTTKPAGEAEAKLLRNMQTGFSLTCGILYRYDWQAYETKRAGDDACQKIAKLHRLGLLAIENGKIHASEAGLELMAKYPIKR